MKDHLVYLEDILESIRKIESYTRNLNTVAFVRDSGVQDAVMRRLAIIGEAVKHLSLDVRERRPEIPWKDIAGMRDVLIHEYAGVHLERIWKTVQEDLPPLKKVVEEILKD